MASACCLQLLSPCWSCSFCPVVWRNCVGRTHSQFLRAGGGTVSSAWGPLPPCVGLCSRRVQQGNLCLARPAARQKKAGHRGRDHTFRLVLHAKLPVGLKPMGSCSVERVMGLLGGPGYAYLLSNHLIATSFGGTVLARYTVSTTAVIYQTMGKSTQSLHPGILPPTHNASATKTHTYSKSVSKAICEKKTQEKGQPRSTNWVKPLDISSLIVRHTRSKQEKNFYGNLLRKSGVKGATKEPVTGFRDFVVLFLSFSARLCNCYCKRQLPYSDMSVCILRNCLFSKSAPYRTTQDQRLECQLRYKLQTSTMALYDIKTCS